MKKILFIAFITTIISFCFLRCEKDDICATTTATTPQLVIEFYDINTPTEKKNITNLLIQATNKDVGILYDQISTLKIPLQSDQNFSDFNFVLNFNEKDTTLQNNDLIRINYTRENQYVSRACGYKTIYNLTQPNPFTSDSDSNNWIKDFKILKTSITNSNETHVTIFH